MSPVSPQRENPAQLELDGVSEGIEALPGRLSRYGKAKKIALDVVDYMEMTQEHQATAKRVKTCGDYLVFRHYYTVDQVRLHGAQLCCKHLLCPLCAIRRGSKALKSYLDRYEVIRAAKPALKPFLVTLTVKDGPDLSERFKHLFKAQHELWKRRSRIYASALDGVAGAVWSYEIKRGKASGEWHPHLHMIALAESMPDADQLSREWHKITGDSFIVDVRPINQADPVSGFMEVFKYAVKFSDQPPADTVHAWQILRGKRLLGSSGEFRGVEVPDNLLDDPEGLQDLPFFQLFYKYLGSAYGLMSQEHGLDENGGKRAPTKNRGRVECPVKPSYTSADFKARYDVLRLQAQAKKHLRIKGSRDRV